MLRTKFNQMQNRFCVHQDLHNWPWSSEEDRKSKIWILLLPLPLLLSLSGSSLMTKEWGNSERDPLKLNLKVWLSRRLSLEKLFLLGGGAMLRPASAWGLILRSPRLSILSLILGLAWSSFHWYDGNSAATLHSWQSCNYWLRFYLKIT